MAGPFSAVMLDIDGTLLDSNMAHAAAWAQVLTEFGYPTTPERMRPLIGMGADHVLPIVCGLHHKSPEGERIRERRSEIWKSRFEAGLQPIDGAAQAVWETMSRGVAVCIVTSANADELKGLLKRAGHKLEDLAADAVSASPDVPSKPDPALLLAGLEKLRLPPAQVAMLGDTEYDLQAAQAAGVAFVGVRTGGRTDAQLQGAAALFDTVAQALASPIFAGTTAVHAL